MRHNAIDRFNAAAAAFTRAALDAAAELRLVADSMEKGAGVITTMGALDFAPPQMQQRAESEATGQSEAAAAAPAGEGDAGEIERGIAAAFTPERQAS